MPAPHDAPAQARGKFEAEREAMRSEVAHAAAAAEGVRKEVARAEAELRDYKSRALVGAWGGSGGGEGVLPPQLRACVWGEWELRPSSETMIEGAGGCMGGGRGVTAVAEGL